MRTVSLTLRGFPADIHAALKKRAAQRSTSLRTIAIDLLKDSVANGARLSEAALRRRIREIPGKRGLNLEETQLAIRERRQ